MLNAPLFKSLAKDVVYELERLFPYASLLATETLGERLTVQTRQQQAEQLDPVRGVVLTVFNGKRKISLRLFKASPARSNLCHGA